jgi:heme-degrading monooxygenase HmoA
VGTYQVPPDKVEEYRRIVQESVYPASKQQPGFRGAYFLVDRATSKVLSISLWATEADMLAGESGGYLREQMAKTAALHPQPPAVEHYEVAAQAEAG